MTIENMLDRGYTLDRISQEVRRIVFARVLKEERKLRGDIGAKGRVAIRLGVHRNTVTREIWHKDVFAEDARRYIGLARERDPPVPKKEQLKIHVDTRKRLMW